MEIIVLGLIVGIWLAHADRKTMKRLFPPSTCLFCKVPIRHKSRGTYIHMDDKKEIHSRINVVGDTITHPAMPMPGQPWELYGDTDYEGYR